VLHISIWGIEALFGGLSGDWTEFWAPCDSVPPTIGLYGVRLIRLWVRTHSVKLGPEYSPKNPLIFQESYNWNLMESSLNILQ